MNEMKLKEILHCIGKNGLCKGSAMRRSRLLFCFCASEGNVALSKSFERLIEAKPIFLFPVALLLSLC